jgi:hypothetical protein
VDGIAEVAGEAEGADNGSDPYNRDGRTDALNDGEDVLLFICERHVEMVKLTRTGET